MICDFNAVRSGKVIGNTGKTAVYVKNASAPFTNKAAATAAMIAVMDGAAEIPCSQQVPFL
jgi:hypothetical protein